MSSMINCVYIYIVRLENKKVWNSWNTRNFAEILLNLDHTGVRVFNGLWETPSSYWIALKNLPDTLYISSHEIRGCAKMYSQKTFPHVKIGHPNIYIYTYTYISFFSCVGCADDKALTRLLQTYFFLFFGRFTSPGSFGIFFSFRSSLTLSVQIRNVRPHSP